MSKSHGMERTRRGISIKNPVEHGEKHAAKKRAKRREKNGRHKK